ncbi:MAG TPA: DUF58 domain-containing protein [Gemmata sp.]|jgi:uncharacterized protein (DUF58 family)|nr:DUF58 domain-containing protein [Gemmata sp.]
MLTARSGWFLFVVLLTLIFGAFVIPYFSVVPALLGITLFAWFALEWALFQTRSLAAVSRLRVSRRILQGDREVPMVWAGLTIEVRVRVENTGPVGIPFAILEDRTAVATVHLEGSTRLFAELRPGETVEIAYKLKAPAPGLLRFEGVRVRVADLQGFFYRRVFLRDDVELLVLPPLTNAEGKQRALKQFNNLPAPGIHRLRRPGSGDELLDLRDYRPGDPPKMIAWKTSARRDKLIIKEFENDVPVRCVLFLDTSEGVRLGPPGNTLLTRLAGVAAVVAQASAANRDLVGLTTFDVLEAKPIKPARTKMHMINLLRRLAEVSALQPGVAGVPPELLTQRASMLAHDLYPELMAKQVNSMSPRRLWIAILDRKWGWLVAGSILIGALLFVLGFWGLSAGILSPQDLVYEGSFPTRAWRWVLRNARAYFVSSINRAAYFVPSHWPFLAKIGLWNLLFLPLYFPPATLAAIFWFFHSIRGFFGARKRELVQRKQLAALFSLQDGTGMDGIERYIHDDACYAERVAKFLQHHLLRCPVPLYDDAGLYRFRCEGKARVLSDAMIGAVGRARDNELYVVLADLSELGADLGPIVKACRVARSRHHHVLVIVPWPADVPSPDDEASTKVELEDDRLERGSVPRPRRKSSATREDVLAKIRSRNLTKVVRQSLTKQYHESFRALRRQLGQAGATIMRMNDGDPVQLVLERLDRLRGMRSRR